MREQSDDQPVALVLAGGGARGAYEVGALSVLLPVLADRGTRPKVIVGNSVGAINASYLAATAHLPADEAIAAGKLIWEGLRFKDLFTSLLAPSALARGLQFLGQFLGLPGVRLNSLLDPSPLTRTLPRIVTMEDIETNRAAGHVNAVGLVATSGLTRRSVVFHAGGGRVRNDPGRQIEYVPATLTEEHVLASAAIPGVLPAVEVAEPSAARGWYIDGGTRLNVPLKPALELQAGRLVVLGLHPPSVHGTRVAGEARPDAFAGISQIVQGLLVDQMTEDVRTLANINTHVAGGPAEGWKQVPYILVTPEQPGEVEQIAQEVFLRRYRRPLRSPSLCILGRATGALAAPENATLLSMLLFDGEYIKSLIGIGERDARRWLDTAHDYGPDSLWQLRPL